MLTSTRNVLQTFSQTITTFVNFYQAGVRYAFNNKVKILLLGSLYIEGWSIIGNAEKKCDALFPVFDYPANDLAKDYYQEFDVYANVAKLSSAEYILIGLHQYTTFQFETQNNLINHLANTNDIIYFSGAAGKFNCQTLCLDKNSQPRVTNHHTDCLPLLPINNDLTCIGWENPELARRLAFNRFLFETVAAQQKVFYQLDKARIKYVALRERVTKVAIGIDASVTPTSGLTKVSTQDKIWFVNMSKLLNTILAIYKEFFANDLAAMQAEITKVRELITDSNEPLVLAERADSIKVLMSAIIPRVDKAMLDLFEEINEFAQYKTKNYDYALNQDMRIEQGLLMHIEISKTVPNKKIFVSHANQYLKDEKNFKFFCNTSRIRSDVYKSIKDKPFAILEFKRR